MGWSYFGIIIETMGRKEPRKGLLKAFFVVVVVVSTGDYYKFETKGGKIKTHRGN